MIRNTMAIAAIISQLSLVAVAQQALPAELVLTTRGELEQVHLPSDVNLRDVPLAQSYDHIVFDARRPAGAVFTYGCEAPERALVAIPSTYSLAGVLDILTAAYTTHNWTVRDGVINLLPEGKLPPLLDTKIDSFTWDTNDTVGNSVGQLFAMIVVERRSLELGFTSEPQSVLGLQKAPCMFCTPQPPTGRKWKVANVTLLTAANRIAASYGKARWIYEERTCGSKTFQVRAY